MTLTPSQIEGVDNSDSQSERLSVIFTRSSPVEAMVAPHNLSPECMTEAGPVGVFGAEYTDQERENILSTAEGIQLDAGEAVFAHETTTERAQGILESGFGNPFEHGGQDAYHIPGSIREGNVFLWPHVSHVGRIDRGGAIVLCTAPIADALVSTYGAYAAINRDNRGTMYTKDRIDIDEYESQYVFEYSTYLDWLESTSGDDIPSVDTLLPYRPARD